MTNSLSWISKAAARPRNRRITYGVMAIILAILCVVPRPWVARAKLLPQDSSSAGLGQIISSLGGQLSNFANILTGGRAPNDLYLIIGRSSGVTTDVIQALDLVGPNRPYDTVREARIDLHKRVDVHLLLGGVVEIETRTHGADESLRLTQAYTKAISARIGQLTRQTTQRKAAIVAQRFEQARQRVADAEGKLDTFRRTNRLADPEIQLGSQLSLRTSLQAQLQARQVEMRSLEQTAGPENVQLQAVRAAIATIQAQLARTDRPDTSAAGPNVAGLTAIQSRYLNLFRDYRFAQALYDVYSRSSEQVAVESLVADSATYIQIVEPPNLDAERAYNILPVALLALLIVCMAVTEIYIPATGLQWPFRPAEHPAEEDPGVARPGY